jgi:hypothetical protein
MTDMRPSRGETAWLRLLRLFRVSGRSNEVVELPSGSLERTPAGSHAPDSPVVRLDLSTEIPGPVSEPIVVRKLTDVRFRLGPLGFRYRTDDTSSDREGKAVATESVRYLFVALGFGSIFAILAYMGGAGYISAMTVGGSAGAVPILVGILATVIRSRRNGQ